MIVLKFGGSSVDSAESIERVVRIVRGLLPRRPVVVVSAMAKTTRRLLKCADAAAAGDLDVPTAWAIYEEVRAYHENVARAVVPPAGRRVLDAMLARWFGELHAAVADIAAAGRLTPRSADGIASYGELLSSSILSLALDSTGGSDDLESPWIDCRQVLITDDSFNRALPIYEETDARLRKALLPHVAAGRVPVMGGYVGATRDGVTTTLGKEGSDFSAAIVGAALDAEEVQIWTDVEGMMTADPRQVTGARRVRTLSFSEALELSCSGAKKPHYGTLGPASRANVPIRILSSWSPHLDGLAEGTVIGSRDRTAPPSIKSITCRDNTRRITVRAAGGAGGPSFLAKVFAVCDSFRPALLVLRSNENNASEVELALSQIDHEDRLFEIRRAFTGVGEIFLAPGRSVITLVSEDLATSPELVQQVLRAAEGLDPRLVVRGVAAPCIRCLVTEETSGVALAALHDRIFAGAPGEPVP
jgi:aspartate kinase